ncbi:hypothetical protein ACLD02_08330 [Alloalcanivorax sp. C16-2]|uniref:hypothetical protein n=1 Tax=Alloalcanivorax sp. C16-2 TaxID=3390052 RepID=UPI00397090DB
MKYIIMIFLGIFMAGQAGAQKVWERGFEVKDVLIYSMAGYGIVTAKLERDSGIDTGCVPTDHHGIFSYWVEGNFNSRVQTWVSGLLAAQAQGGEVDILIDTDQCNTAGQWDAFGAPAGLGQRFTGVRVKTP